MSLSDSQSNIVQDGGLWVYTVPSDDIYTLSAQMTIISTTPGIFFQISQFGSQSVVITAPSLTTDQYHQELLGQFICVAGDELRVVVSGTTIPANTLRTIITVTNNV